MTTQASDAAAFGAATKALEQIKTDLDVECTCHAHHGPLCPKRIADAALKACGGFAVPDDLGFSARRLADNPALVEAVAAALSKTSETRWKSWGLPDPMENQWRDTIRDEARVALLAIDEFQRGGP